MRLLKLILTSVYVILIIILLLNFRSCDRSNPTEEDLIRKAETFGQKGKLKVTLLWNYYADVDLHVIEPDGNEIYYSNQTNASTGGALDVDNTRGGANSAENIYWENPPKGEYKIFVEYFSINTLIPSFGPCYVVVAVEGQEPVTYTINLTYVKQKVNVCEVAID